MISISSAADRIKEAIFFILVAFIVAFLIFIFLPIIIFFICLGVGAFIAIIIIFIIYGLMGLRSRPPYQEPPQAP